MPTIRTIKNRITAIGTIRKIASALQVVSLTRLRQIEMKTVKAKAYFDLIRELAQGLSENLIYEAHPLLKPRKEIKRIGLVALTSDKGLCGSFNTAIFRETAQFFSQHDPQEISCISIGKKGAAYFSKKGISAAKEYSSSLKTQDYVKTASEIAEIMTGAFLSKSIDELYVVYNQFRLHLLGKAAALKVLPLKIEAFKIKKVRDYIYEPTPYIVLDRMLKEYAANQIAQAMLESSASEEMSRMMAMKQACENADQAISRFNLQYHKARQSQITKELVEIATAAEAA